jgi:cation:H+ antiporter
MINILFLLAGFFPLIYGANFLVDSASSIAKKFKIPNIVIGLTIVAFGTSSPELIVNVFGAISGKSEMVLGNVIGSNIFNILMILGISSIIYPIAVKKDTVKIEIPLCILSSLIVILLANDRIIDGMVFSMITRIDGILLLLFFVIFMIYNFQLMKKEKTDEEIEIKEYTTSKSIIFLLLGFALLVLGGRMIVVFGIKFAQSIGISERIIALTIVSIGTSLPELATSAVAAKKRNIDIAIGNIVGSNLFNIFLILGISAFINPITLSGMINFDMIVNIIASILLLIFVFTGKGRKIERWEGVIFVFLYLTYLSIILII